VPETLGFRVDLQPSRRAGRVRAFARLLTLLAAVACGAAAALEPSPARIAAVLAAGGASVLAFRRGRPARPLGLAVDVAGTVSIAADDADHPAVVRYFGRHLVCLETPGGLHAVWPDSMSLSHWRRLLVACRWQRRQPDAGAGLPAGPRTK
jgi:hypothetical protein